MLLVRTWVDRSSIHGFGLFAGAAIPAGSAVWRFTPGFDLDLDPASLGHVSEIARERLLHYGYIDLRLHRYILCCDDARFINHSSKPNLRADLSEDAYGIECAGLNRHGVEDVRALRERSSDPHGPEFCARPIVR